MGLLQKLFGRKPQASTIPSSSIHPELDPAKDPNMVRVFDGYGRELFITKQQWKDNVLLGNLEKQRNDPEQLYSMIVGALQDGFAADVVPYAEHLLTIDPIPSRGATLLGVTYMEVNRLDEAQRVLEKFIAEHGEEGVVLTNLAKVYSRRGDDEQAERILWHAIELDPNQENGLGWYAAIQNERGGEAARTEAFRKVAAIAGSWRARLWLARDALQQKDLSLAEKLYAEAISMAEHPAPTDLLMQMSGDLGNSGHLAEIIRLTEPCFDHVIHGLQVGNNLIKAHLDLGHIQEAQHILNQLYSQKRPDWRQNLSFWDTELAKARIAAQAKVPAEGLSCTLISVEGPLWTRDSSPFGSLLPAKPTGSIHIAIMGSTALLANPSEQPTAQLADGPGRFSRAVPLVLAEHIHLATNAVGLALIPWVQGQGFAFFGKPYDSQSVCEIAGRDENPASFVLQCTLDATQQSWNLDVCLLRQSDASRIGEASFSMSPDNLGAVLEQITGTVEKLLVTQTGVRSSRLPKWYQRPTGPDASDYLLRLEQQLAVMCMNLDFLEGGGLSGERDILDGTLQLSLRYPSNHLVRMILSQTALQMKKARPEIMSEYASKLELLNREHPLSGNTAVLIQNAISKSLK